MLDKIMTLLVGLLIALGGWSLSRTFELSTVQAVQDDKVNRLERHVDKLQNHIENMMKSDEDIIEQHKKLFDMLEEGDTPTTGYNY
jgi:peptidoglycan hydrolase CwlO-like protein